MATLTRPERVNVPPMTRYRVALTLSEVASLLGVGYGRMFRIRDEAADFPTPVLLPGTKTPKYLRSDVLSWLRSLPRARRKGGEAKGQ